MHSITWWHFQWPWRTPDPDFKVTTFFKVEYLKDKVAIAQDEKYLTYGRVLCLVTLKCVARVSVFLLDPDDRGDWKAGEVIQRSGGQVPQWGRAPGGGGAKPSKTGVWGRSPGSWTGFNDYTDISGWNFVHKMLHIQHIRLVC